VSGTRSASFVEWELELAPLDDILTQILGEDRKGGPTPWGWHRWEDLLKCPRKYNLLYNLNYIPQKYSEALAFGSLMHECLAFYYTEVDAFLGEEDPVLANERFDSYCSEPQWRKLLWEVEGLADDSYVPIIEDVHRVMRAYMQQYPLVTDKFLQYELVGVEEYAEVSSPLQFSTRLDLVYRAEAGLWATDHKTSRALTQDLTSGWALNGQMLGLMHTAPQHWPDERVLGVIINVIVRTRDPQFKRVMVPLSADMVTGWVDKMCLWIDKVLPFYETVDWPPNYASCIHRYGKCPFYDYCETDTLDALCPAEAVDA